MKPIKTLNKIIISIVLSLSIYFLLDIYLTRGYFSQRLYPERLNRKAIDGSSLIDFQINKLRNGNYGFLIKNRKPSIFYFIAYRDGKVILSKDQVKIFNYGRVKIETPIYQSKENSGFDCGTGLGLITINPFEVFKKELNYDQLLEKISYRSQITRRRDTSYHDLIYDKPLILKERGSWREINSRSSIEEVDSISVSFYMPIYSIIRGQELKIYSNSIMISYKDVINKLAEKYRILK